VKKHPTGKRQNHQKAGKLGNNTKNRAQNGGKVARTLAGPVVGAGVFRVFVRVGNMQRKTRPRFCG